MSALTLADASRMIREAVKDRSYRSTPLGLEVARYYRWKKNEWGAAPDTLRDYEPICAKLALYFADLELADFTPPVGTERLRECWDHYWGDKTARTRAKVRSVWVDFFDWAVRERGLHGNPARALAAPKRRGVKREPFGGNLVEKVIVAQAYLADKLGVILVLKYGLRRAELAQVRFRDFDFERRQLIVMGKGGKPRVLPIVEEAFWRDLGAVELELGGSAVARDLFVVCPRRRVGMRTYYQHHHGFVPRSVHRWWYDRLEEAGVVGEVRRGMGMHRGRHTVATEILRKTGNIVAAKEALGHADIQTTEQAYASFNTEDLAQLLRSIREEM